VRVGIICNLVQRQEQGKSNVRASMAHQGRGEKQALLKKKIQYKDDFRDLEVRADKKPLPARVAVQEHFEVDDDTLFAFQVVYADLYLPQPYRPQALKPYPYLPSQLSRVQSYLKRAVVRARLLLIHTILPFDPRRAPPPPSSR
jgi:hypothetical protein